MNLTLLKYTENGQNTTERAHTHSTSSIESILSTARILKRFTPNQLYRTNSMETENQLNFELNSNSNSKSKSKECNLKRITNFPSIQFLYNFYTIAEVHFYRKCVWFFRRQMQFQTTIHCIRSNHCYTQCHSQCLVQSLRHQNIINIRMTYWLQYAKHYVWTSYRFCLPIISTILWWWIECTKR